MVVYGDPHVIVRSIDLVWGGSIRLLVVVSVNIVVRSTYAFGSLYLEVWDFRGRFQGFVRCHVYHVWVVCARGIQERCGLSGYGR